jgi:hypothetical protein
MTRRGRGRPRKTEREHMGQLLWLERLLEEETTALRRQGRKPTKVLIRAAAKLDMSESSAWRLKAELDQANTIDLSTTPLGAWLRELRDDAAAQEAMSRFFDSTFL